MRTIAAIYEKGLVSNKDPVDFNWKLYNICPGNSTFEKCVVSIMTKEIWGKSIA